jgi:hypothetical protein
MRGAPRGLHPDRKEAPAGAAASHLTVPEPDNDAVTTKLSVDALGVGVVVVGVLPQAAGEQRVVGQRPEPGR